MLQNKALARKLLCATMLSGMAFAAPSAFAQEEESAASEDTITVTGTRIQSANLVATSPVTTIDASEIAGRGVIRVEDMVNQLPQAFAAQGSNISNGSTGTAQVNLRGLGAQRNLVLLNGRRLPYGSPRSVPADVNQVPSALVERVEVLTGGASAVYGSDAITGVVNFILDDDFEGLRIDTQYSFYQHNNENSTIQDLVSGYAAGNPSQFKLPDDNVVDGEAVEISAVMGVNTPDGRGNASAYISYRNVNPVYQANRDYSACAFGTQNGGTEFSCSGSSTNATANFLNLGTDPALANFQSWFRTNGSQFIDRDFTSDTFNFNPFNFYQRPDERYTVGSFINYEFSRHFDAYAELSFMDNTSNSQIAPSGVFGGGVAGQGGGINCNNAFLTAQQVDFLCTQNGLGPTDVAEGVLILRRNVEGGSRNSDIRHTTYRGVVGLRGQVADSPFDYDVYASYSNVSFAENYNNELSIRKSSLALNAVDDGAGNIVCAVNADADPSNDDAACVPYNIFSGTPSAAAIAYITNPLLQRGTVTQQVVSGSMFGDLGAYGLVSPFATSGVGVAFGAEYRRDSLSLLPDSNYQSGDGFGQGGPTPPVSGTTDVWEVFGEAQIPIIEGAQFAEVLAVELAYRYSDYSTGVSTDTYKVAGEWAPIDDLRFRGSYQRAVRAPNVIELFSNQSIGLFDLTQGANGLYDPCAGANPSATLAQCQNTGVTAAQYGNIADNPAGQFNQLGGGNPNLDPEVADTYTIGFIFTPSFIEGLTITADYFDIEVEDTVSTVSPNQSLTQCLATGDQSFCSLVNRGDGGTLWANPSGFIVATNTNIGSLSTSGFDISATYSLDLENFVSGSGSLELEYVGTLLDSLETVSSPTATPFDCVGFYSSSCGTPNPEYRHKATATWLTPFNADFTLSWRHFGEVEIFGGGAAINQTLESQDWFDLSGNFYARDNVRFRAGVNNIFDKEPPLSAAVGAGFGNGNTYPQVYDALGRYVFAGVTVEF
ncbi:TonB-dependent receptor plug domain-containing protein [Oceanicaulis alexandrii]|uniref:TonB-dependent receptor plug domain-containing protein n=3 Tax=Alphaproteobacteria TaxID=28211 RepID=UPI00041DE04D|nr:TonB-dependent receptor [Oceanicaulis alexandrii]